MEIKAALRTWKENVLYGVLAVVLGAVVGVICAVFGRGLIAISAFREAHLLPLILLLAPAGLLMVWCYTRFGAGAGRGMGLVFAVGHGEEEKIPMRLVPLVLLSTWLTHLCGGSAGREGVAVQIGATVSHWAARRLAPEAGKIFLLAGMAAGFAGLFRTPIAAVLFALEVLWAGKICYQALFPAFLAAFTASGVSGLLGLGKFTAEMGEAWVLDWVMLAKLLGLGILFGLAGRLFCHLLAYTKGLFARKMENPYVRVAVVGVCLTVVLLALHQGRYCGLGTNLIESSFTGGAIYGYDWILKLVLTIATLSAGFQGGEVTPLFAIGASLGVALAGVFGLPVELVAALGYAAVFGSATNTFLAPIMIGAEAFGFAHLPMFFVVCTAAYCFGSHKSIYGAQKTLED